jgi:hypothetical protein
LVHRSDADDPVIPVLAAVSPQVGVVVAAVEPHPAAAVGRWDVTNRRRWGWR